MLRRYHGLDCQCHGGPPIGSPWTWQWLGYRYCTVCLHSIGRNAAGNLCTSAQYKRAWRILAS